ncbi:deleted in autism-related protein 1-like [Scleropages formosus]|uniref:Deleted in autism-related protein 1-like n=1 Tax=Scleropages formosus TaxID=113540 RepID=A0A0N8JX18_SCLFO|nr:deleted in autism-related protein 1-like [Scleropages formosus]
MDRLLMEFGALWWALAGMVSLAASATPPSLKKEYSFGRSFLGLDKCNACVGTSICKKFFKEEIRFEKWPSPRLQLPPINESTYLGYCTDSTESWRPAVLSRLIPHELHELSDRSICESVGREPTCSIEAVLRATPRFQSWAQSDLLLPHLVQGLASPMLRCPSQRLLDRIVRRYTEVTDVGSILMKHFSERDKLRLLYTLAVNQHPLVLQMFPGTEGWPFPRYQGSCGRVIVHAGTRPLADLFGGALATRADAAYQLLHMAESLRTNSLHFNLYYTHVADDMFATFEDGRVVIVDASAIGIIDRLEELPQKAEPERDHTDIFSCLGLSCKRALPCSSVRPSQSIMLLCQHPLPRLLLPQDLQGEARHLLGICADPAQSDWSILAAASKLMDVLRPLRPCSPRLSYRYPECTYSSQF